MLRYLDPEIGERTATLQPPLAGGIPTIVGIATVTATVDPGPTNDVTQGIQVGAVWFNSTAGQLRWWECYSNAQGVAKWVFSGADYANGGTTPSTEQTAFGQGAGTIAAEGNINRQISSAGVNCGGTGADYVLAVYALPGNSFDQSGRGVNILAEGSFASNGDNKRVKVIFNPATAVVGQQVGGGGTTIADTGVVTTSGAGWSVEANVFKYGANGSNTQIGLHQQAQIGNAVASMLSPQLITATENAPILVAITGNATTTATDIALNFLEVNAMN